MPRLTFDISISLDGFIAGPNPRLEAPLGDGGERLHEWVFGLAAWREAHGYEGGDAGADSEVVAESLAGVGSYLMGRSMFGGGDGPWGEEPWEGWWGDEPPFGLPVFVLTHHAREPLVKGRTTFTFVTDGVESALEQARAAAGDGDVRIAGGGSIAQQYLDRGLLDDFQVHVVPLLLGGGTRLFERLDRLVELEPTRVIASPGVTHITYGVVNGGEGVKHNR
jgi:dihydrofolate reductase